MTVGELKEIIKYAYDWDDIVIKDMRTDDNFDLKDVFPYVGGNIVLTIGGSDV